MKTKLVYIVVSTESDTYLEQALVSVYSARFFNPNSTIELVVDQMTAATLNGKREEIKKYISDIIVIETSGDYNQKQRSRFLKTNLRNYIKGDYIFIDTDTVICASLEDIDYLEWDIAAVREKNKFDSFTKRDEYMWKLAEKVGIQDELREQPYFNSGVMYVKDTDKAHRLYDSWHSLWIKYQTMGLDTDQTPLAMANKLCAHPIYHINDMWNCQIKFQGISSINEARIIHYFIGMKEDSFLFSWHSLHETIKQIGNIPPLVANLIQDPKTAFCTNGNNVEYCIKSIGIYQIYQKQAFFFQVLNFEARLLLKVSNFLQKRNAK